MNTATNGQDDREYLDDLLCEVDEWAIQHLIPVVEAYLKQTRKPYKVRESAEPQEPKEKRPARAYCKVKIPEGRIYPGLGRGGDTLHCKRLAQVPSYMPRSTPGAKKHGLIGVWLVFWMEDGSLKIIFPDKFGHRDMRGRGYSKEGVFEEETWIEFLDIDDDRKIYGVMEVIPGHDWDWLRDREFCEALQRCGGPSDKVVT